MKLDLTKSNTHDKLAELILHIINQCQDDLFCGATWLNKALYYIDVSSYLRTGKQITGSRYMRLPNGPVPKSLVPVRQQLIDDHSIQEKEVTVGGHIQKRLVPLREANLEIFDQHQIKIANNIIRILRGKTAKEVSQLSHDRVWEITQHKEIIPLSTAFIAADPPTDKQVKRGIQLSKKYGWENA